MALMRSALLWASRNHWLAVRFPKYRFAQAAVRRFMPGTTADAALDASERFRPSGITTVLTRLGENLTDLSEATAVVDHYTHLLGCIADRRLPAQLSIKLTQLGLDIAEQAAHENALALAERARATGNVMWIDMEDSSYTDRTIALFESILATHRNVGLCVQSYLFRTERDLERLLQKTVAIRLVKGAYREPASIAFPHKRDVDANYLRLGRLLLSASRSNPDGPRPALGTHDTALVRQLAAFAATEGIRKDAYEVQMLYGIGTAEQQRLAQAGHRVRVLISYGEEWFPWYVRRLAERPANIWFVVKNVLGR